MSNYDFKLVSSMEKVFGDEEPKRMINRNLHFFYSDKISFQIAVYAKEYREISLKGLDITVSWPNHKMRTVELVPVAFPTNGNDDEFYLRKTPGLYPDLLSPMDGNFMPVAKQWRAVWIDLFSNDELPDKNTEVEITVSEEGELLFSDTITIIPVRTHLEKQRVHHTEWFHADCLADYYKLEPYSEEHWISIENNLRFLHDDIASTMVLTPIFTPALDTEVGGERTTVQLLDVYLDNGKWSFGFDRLKRWCELTKKIGFEYLEICHLFSQWGATAAPKVMAYVDGKYQRVFGWETIATEEKYVNFLNTLLPQLFDALESFGYDKAHLFTHISDEPKPPTLETYVAARKTVIKALEGTCVFDALSDYQLYEKKAVDYPVVSDNHIQTYLDNGVKDLWVYYCVSQSVLVPNRFMAMPPYRARVIGMLMWYYKIQGFLHWGYNFYNNQYSKKQINPFCITDSGARFPSGDPFLVYPGEDLSPLGSLRCEYVFQSFRDIQILDTAEKKLGREAIERIIGPKPTFENYPQETHYIESIIDSTIEELIRNM